MAVWLTKHNSRVDALAAETFLQTSLAEARTAAASVSAMLYDEPS
jgi:hypothetical protein